MATTYGCAHTLDRGTSASDNGLKKYADFGVANTTRYAGVDTSPYGSS